MKYIVTQDEYINGIYDSETEADLEYQKIVDCKKKSLVPVRKNEYYLKKEVIDVIYMVWDINDPNTDYFIGVFDEFSDISYHFGDDEEYDIEKFIKRDQIICPVLDEFGK